MSNFMFELDGNRYNAIDNGKDGYAYRVLYYGNTREIDITEKEFRKALDRIR